MMDNEKYSAALSRFVQYVSQQSVSRLEPLTIDDLRLGIRNERLSEISDWSNCDLDAIEVHAAQMQDDAPLDQILSFPREASSDGCSTVSNICSPSPVAWM